jgi:PAS domain S-box-containing protein
MNSILIASCNKCMRDTLRIMLPGDNIVHSASTMDDAVKLMLTEEIEVLIIDLPLGRGNGIQILRKVTGLGNHVTVIATVESKHIEVAKEAELLGVYHVLEKPFSQKEFRSVFAKALDRQNILAEKKQLEGELRKKAGEVPVSSGTGYNKEMDLLYKSLAKAMTGVLDLANFLKAIVAILEGELQTERILVLLYDKETRSYTVRAHHGYRSGMAEQLTLRGSDESILYFQNRGNIVRAGEALSTSNMSAEASLRKLMSSFKLELLIGLKSRGELLGLLGIGDKLTGRPYNDVECQILGAMAHSVSMAIENCLLYREVFLARQHIENVLANIPSGVITIDGEEKVSCLNQAAMNILGVSAEDCVGKRMEDAHPGLARLLHETLREGKPCHRVEFYCDELEKPLGISSARIKSADGEVVGALMVFTDLSDIKLLEKKLAESRKAEFWDQLVRRISHEVKNPLVAIKTFAQLLPEKYEEEEFRQDFYRLVNMEINRLNDIIEKMTQLTNLKPSCLRAWDLHTLLDNVLGNLQNEIKKHKISVVRRYNLSNPETTVDFDQIQEAFANIITNALEAMEKGGTLTIATSEEKVDGSDSLIEFLDDGPGVINGDEGKLFDPFYTTKAKGFGLGLPIAKRIIEGHGGTVRAVRLSPRGVSMRVLLPRGKGEVRNVFDTGR